MDFATYTIKYGDTLQSIAQDFTGNPWKYIEIVQSNPQLPHTTVEIEGIKFPTLTNIAVGQRIHIPMYWINRETYVHSPLVGLGQIENDEIPIGMPNPASEYCLEHGGELKVIKDKEGNDHGICKFPDGTECEEWAYERGECKQGDCIHYGIGPSGEVICLIVPEQKVPHKEEKISDNTKVAGYVVGGMAVAFLLILGTIAVVK